MILLILQFLKSHWRAVALLGALIALCLLVWSKLHQWGEQRYSDGYSTRDREYVATLLAVQLEYNKQVEQQQRDSNEISAQYQEQLTAIRNRKPAPVVRLSNSASGSCLSTSSGTSTTSGSDDTPAKELPEATGPDIGQPLYSIADDADAQAVQLEKLQNWIRRVCSARVK